MSDRPRGLVELDRIDAVFGALAHATRRHILVVLRARGGTMTSGELARRFDCAWPTTTRHLGVLVDAGLVTVTKEGRARRYQLDEAMLDEVAGRWLDGFRPDS